MKIIVVGFGSIGSRHSRILTELGHEVAVVSQRQVEFPLVFNNLIDALKWDPNYVVVANKTVGHLECLTQLSELGFCGTVLVEKPLFHRVAEFFPSNFKNCFVAYNLRFHPLLTILQNELSNEKVISAQIYVGQFLPNWRPQSDYRMCYSASSIEGGGVLRDLSHEIDYLHWLFGGIRRVVGLGGQFSSLEIDSEDMVCVLMELEKCPIVTIQLNYLDRQGRREILINTDRRTIFLDFSKGLIEINGIQNKCINERDLTYTEMHRAIISGLFANACSFKEGLEVLKTIEAIELSIRDRRWVACE